MRKFKLIKEYPGSPNLGTTCEERNNKSSFCYYFEGEKNIGITKDQVENQPEYWEEVIEKEYEILISRVVPQEILSVKRLSDGEIFTVGDKITGYHKDARTIQTIRICTYIGVIRLEQSGGYTDLRNATKVKQPIFLTHDGKDIFEGDTVWWVRKDSTSIIGRLIIPPGEKFNSDMTAYFLTKEAAEDYIERNKPRLSIEDCFKILQKSFLYGNGFEEEIEKYIRKNNK